MYDHYASSSSPLNLKDRIAAFQQQRDAAESSNPKNSTLKPPPHGSLKDKIASFEKQGAVPMPRSSFGLGAPPPAPDDASSRRHGELYGNRVAGLSRPHILAPTGNPSTAPPSNRTRSVSTPHLDRFLQSPSPPGTPALPRRRSTHPDTSQTPEINTPAEHDDCAAPNPEAESPETPAIVVSSEALAVDQPDATGAHHEEPVGPAPDPEQVVAAEPESAIVGETSNLDELISEGSPSVSKDTETPQDPEVVICEPAPAEETMSPTSHSPVSVASPDAAKLEQNVEESGMQFPGVSLDQSSVPSETLQTLSALGMQHSVQELLDQLLLQEDMLDIATPVRQRFSLNGRLSPKAVLDYIVQQQSASAVRDSGVVGASQSVPGTPFSPTLSVGSTYSLDSPGGESPLSPTSDIYSAYLATTPAMIESFSRALPSIPESEAGTEEDPLSPANTGRKTSYSQEYDLVSVSDHTTGSSAPISTPSDDGVFLRRDSTKSDDADGPDAVRISGPPRITSPPLVLVIPNSLPLPKPAAATDEALDAHEAVIVLDPPRKVSPTVSRGVLVPAPQSAAPSPVSANASPVSAYSPPVSTYSPGSIYSPASSSPALQAPSSRGSVSRSVSLRSKAVSPTPSGPYEEPEFTPVSGPKSFHAVVHERVVEPTSRSRPTSAMSSYHMASFPSPPLNAAAFGELGSLLADAALLEQQLANIRTPAEEPRKEKHNEPKEARERKVPSTSMEHTNSRISVERIDPRISVDRQDPRISVERREPRISVEQPRKPVDRQEATEPREPSTIAAPAPIRPSSVEQPVPMSLRSKPTQELPESVDDHEDSSRASSELSFLAADPRPPPRIPLPPRPNSAMSQVPAPSPPPPPVPLKGSSRQSKLSGLLSRAKSSHSLRPMPGDYSRESFGSELSSEDSVPVSTPPSPPLDPMTLSISSSMSSDASSIRSTSRSWKMSKNGLSRATMFADKLLHKREHHNSTVPTADYDISEDDDMQQSSRALPRPPRPLPLPPRPLPPRGLPPPAPGGPPTISLPPPPQPQSQNGRSQPANRLSPPQQQQRLSWLSITSPGGLNDSPDTATLFDSFPSVPDNVPLPLPSRPHGLAPRPPLPPQPHVPSRLPPPSAGYPGSSGSTRSKGLPARPNDHQKQRSAII
ncbi:hypothetical protein A0H81_14277 [Grifola frondosa]|uniref:Uncharacterized protein n=1 Tax=Grifola frondosa TaxID=5627 RepID=A0A1C7LLZ3_GRIFR|nr:hypothetical protein A0H81_14277 [Grifola frondosa]